MTTIREIIEVLENFAPPHLQEVWDNCGVQVGFDCEQACTGIVLSLDVSQRAIQTAVENNANLLITHHPLTIEGIRQFTPQVPRAQMIATAIKHNITIYSAHTSLDSCAGGINDHLAHVLGLSNTTVLEPNAKNPEVGIGRIGTLPRKMKIHELAQHISDTLKVRNIRYNESTKDIERVAICSGSGGSLIGAATAAEVDAYICSDLKYHNFESTAENKLGIVEIGHFESEICSLDIFVAVISKKIPTFAPLRVEENPVKYLQTISKH